MKDSIRMICPLPYQEVEPKFFVISGWIPESWLENGSRIDDRMFMDFIDIDGKTFIGSNANIVAGQSQMFEDKKYLKFYAQCQFSYINASFINKSQGLITIKLSAHKKDCQLFLPIVIKSPNPNFKADQALVEKHRRIGEMIMQYESDLREYYKGLERIQERRKLKSGITKEDESIYQNVPYWQLADGFLDIFEQTEENINEDYPFIKEDLEEKCLEKKYKDAIEWQGPLCGGLIGMMNGFEFRTYSNDHDKHFHVIHKGRRINARFSYPEIELINFKNIKSF